MLKIGLLASVLWGGREASRKKVGKKIKARAE